MDKQNPKDESPEKVKFANSLVAMYGSGSDTSEDEEAPQNISSAPQVSTEDVTASPTSVQSDLFQVSETEESQKKTTTESADNRPTSEEGLEQSSSAHTTSVEKEDAIQENSAEDSDSVISSKTKKPEDENLLKGAQSVITEECLLSEEEDVNTEVANSSGDGTREHAKRDDSTLTSVEEEDSAVTSVVSTKINSDESASEPTIVEKAATSDTDVIEGSDSKQNKLPEHEEEEKMDVDFAEGESATSAEASVVSISKECVVEFGKSISRSEEMAIDKASSSRVSSVKREQTTKTPNSASDVEEASLETAEEKTSNDELIGKENLRNPDIADEVVSHGKSVDSDGSSSETPEIGTLSDDFKMDVDEVSVEHKEKAEVVWNKAANETKVSDTLPLSETQANPDEMVQKLENTTLSEEELVSMNVEETEHDSESTSRNSESHKEIDEVDRALLTVTGGGASESNVPEEAVIKSEHVSATPLRGDALTLSKEATLSEDEEVEKTENLGTAEKNTSVATAEPKEGVQIGERSSSPEDLSEDNTTDQIEIPPSPKRKKTTVLTQAEISHVPSPQHTEVTNEDISERVATAKLSLPKQAEVDQAVSPNKLEASAVVPPKPVPVEHVKDATASSDEVEDSLKPVDEAPLKHVEDAQLASPHEIKNTKTSSPEAVSLEQEEAKAAASPEQEEAKAAASPEQEEAKAAALPEQEEARSITSLEQDKARLISSSEQGEAKAAASPEQEEAKAAASPEREEIKAAASPEQEEVKSDVSSDQEEAKAAASTEQEEEEVNAAALPEQEEAKAAASSEQGEAKTTASPEQEKAKASSTTVEVVEETSSEKAQLSEVPSPQQTGAVEEIPSKETEAAETCPSIEIKTAKAISLKQVAVGEVSPPKQVNVPEEDPLSHIKEVPEKHVEVTQGQAPMQVKEIKRDPTDQIEPTEDVPSITAKDSEETETKPIETVDDTPVVHVHARTGAPSKEEETSSDQVLTSEARQEQQKDAKSSRDQALLIPKGESKTESRSLGQAGKKKATLAGKVTKESGETRTRRLRQIRHPSFKAAEAAADAAFVAAVTPTKTNLKEAKIACAIANVTETSEVLPKEHLAHATRQRRNRSSSAEPQPSSSEPEPADVATSGEEAKDKPVSIKIKIGKDHMQIVSNDPQPDPTVPLAETKRPKKDFSDLQLSKEAPYMKHLEVQIPPSDVSLYETTTMSPGGTLRKHKRLKEGSASPSTTLSPITLKIAKDKSKENLCCIVPEEIRTASPIESEGRAEKITLKISKDDGVCSVKSSVSPLVSPVDRSDEARSEKITLKLAKEEAASLARSREGVSSPRSDDGENRLERITLKLAAGEKNSWSIKSADSDSALSPSSTDSGSIKLRNKAKLDDLAEGESSKSSKRSIAQTLPDVSARSDDCVLQIAPNKRPLEDIEEAVSNKVIKLEVDTEEQPEEPEVEVEEEPIAKSAEEAVQMVVPKIEPSLVDEEIDQKPNIEEILLDDCSMPADPPSDDVASDRPESAMDVDDDVVILSSNISKKPRGRPRKAAHGESTPTTPASAVTVLKKSRVMPVAPPAVPDQSTLDRPKRVCKGRERLPPKPPKPAKPVKPRGRYANLMKQRLAEEAAAAAAAGTSASSSSSSATVVPVAVPTRGLPRTVPVSTSLSSPSRTPLTVPEILARNFLPAVTITPILTPIKSPARTPVRKAAGSSRAGKGVGSAKAKARAKANGALAAKVGASLRMPGEAVVEILPMSAKTPASHYAKVMRPEAPQVFEEETQMSADISTRPPSPVSGTAMEVTDTEAMSATEATESSTPAPTSSAPSTSSTQAQSDGKQISFSSPIATIDKTTGLLPRLVITPLPPSRCQTPSLSTTGEESQSNPTTELTNKGNKKGRMEVVDPDAKVDFTVDMIAEYMWPVDKPGVRGEIYMIQEQISLYLGVKSFKRKYPSLYRRPVEHEERQYLLDRKLVTEGLCDMGLTAVLSHEVLDIMCADFPEKYEEYRKFSREKAQRELSNKQQRGFSGLDRIRVEDSTSVSQRDAASFNSMLNRERREQRRCFFDLQSFGIQYSESRRRKMVPPNVPKVGHYPVALVPGQYTDYYKKYTATELRYFPLNTVVYGPLLPGELRTHLQGGSEGSQSDSSDSSSSDSESSNSSSSGSSDSDSSSEDSEEELNTQISASESRDSASGKDTTPCKVCQGDRHKNKVGVPEPLINCAVCSSSGHPTCLDLTVDMVPHIRKYDWQCTDCKTCAQCKDPADEDKMLFCDMCDRGYHIYCVGLRKVPEGRWHCKECALCSSCGSREPGGLPEQQQALAQNSTPNKPEMPQWQHEFKKGDKGTRVYVRTLCVPCYRLWKKGRYCRLCWKCYGNKPEEEGLINCSACDRWMHSDCCRLAGSVIDTEKTSNFLCELCQQKGVRSPTKGFKTPVR